jgi:hypothetical protein
MLQSSLHSHMRCLYFCHCPPLLPKVPVLYCCRCSMMPVELPDSARAIVAGQCCYLRVPALLSLFTAATRAAFASVDVFWCRLSCHYYCRCHLLPRKVPVLPCAVLCCHLRCLCYCCCPLLPPQVPVLLSLSSAAASTCLLRAVYIVTGQKKT